jgi:hypothetical protein
MAERGSFVVLEGVPLRTCTICANKRWLLSEVEAFRALARDISYMRYVGSMRGNVVGSVLCFVCQTRLAALPPAVWDAFQQARGSYAFGG